MTLASSRDFEALCALGGGNCEVVLNDAGADAVPNEPPHVLASWVLEPARSGDIMWTGGRVLELCGVDHRGRAYRTQMLVFESGDGLRAIEPIYWSGLRIAVNSVIGERRDTTGPCPTD